MKKEGRKAGQNEAEEVKMISKSGADWYFVHNSVRAQTDGLNPNQGICNK